MRTALPVMLLLFLVACGDTMPQYRFVPPDSDAGRACVAGCDQAARDCYGSCGVDKQRCRHRAEDNAEAEYQNYVSQSRRSGRVAVKSESDFFGLYRCGSTKCEENCELGYRTCFRSCGGALMPL